MIFQHSALVSVQQFGALVDLCRKPCREAARAFGPILVDDVYDEAPVALFGKHLMAERAEGTL